MWNTLRTLWGLSMETLVRIHESCKSQSHLEFVDIFTPTRHILQSIRRTWKTNRVHGLPAVAAPTYFPSESKGNDTWWGSQDTETVYLWDSMDDQHRQNTLKKLKTASGWTIWKTRDKEWSPALNEVGFHQLLEKTRTHYRGCHILATQQRSYYIHLYRRLAPDRGGKPRQTGRMAKEDAGLTSRPEENA